MDFIISSTSWIPGPAKVIFLVLAVAFLYKTRPGQQGKTISSWSTDYPKQSAKRKNSILNPKEKSSADV